MKLVAIVPNDPLHASTWWRIRQPFRYLTEHNKKIMSLDEYVHITPKGCFKDAVVFLHRLIFDDPKAEIRRLRRLGAKVIIYSLDDRTTNVEALSEYLTDCGALTQAYLDTALTNVAKQVELIKLCDVVISSTAELSQLVFEDIHTLPVTINNGIPLDFWFESQDLTQRDENIVTVGWAGGRRPDSDLEPMATAWKRICEEPEFNNVRFVVGGYQADIIDRNIDLDRKTRVPWKAFEEWPRTMQVDVGCCPLADTAFNQGKSPIKWFEYSASKAATVVSPTVYSNVTIDMLNSRVAHDADEWYFALSDEIRSAGLRKQLNSAAMYDLMNYHSLESTIIDWRVLLNRFE